MTGVETGRPLTERTVRRAARELAEADQRLEASVERYGPPPLWRREPSYATLVHLILEQQVSLASAQAAFDRLRAALGGSIEPAEFLRLSDAELRAVGFSRQKTGYARTLASAMLDGFDLETLAAMPDDEVRRALIAMPGIGPWTADIYLLFCLGNADAWPAGDLALQEAARLAFNLRKRPDAKAMVKLADVWRPWRGVAAHLLWAYYHVVKRREGAPIQESAKGSAKKKKAVATRRKATTTKGAANGR